MRNIGRITCGALVGLLVFCMPVHGQRLSRLTSLGALDEPPEAVFGQVTDVTVDAAQNTYILDALSYELRVFDQSGRFLAAAGKRGSGPGEFLAPVSVAVRASGDILVLDQSNNRIERWRLQGTTLQRQGSYPLSFFARKMCAIGDRVFVLGQFRDALVHEIAANGSIVRSVIQPPGMSTELLSKMTASDMLWCDAENQRLILANHLRPDIFIYSLSGALQERLRIEPFRQIVVRTAGPGAVTYSEPKEGRYDIIAGVVVHEGRLLIQLGHDTRGDAVTNVRSYEVANSGSRQIATRLPLVVKKSGNVVVGKQTEPFPAVALYRLDW